MRVAKILWQEVEASPAEDGKLDRQTLSEGQLEMSAEELLRLKESLGKSAVLLPQGARKFQDWDVALLSRFTVEDMSA